MPKWTRRSVLSAVFGIPLAYWSGFWRGMGVKPLYFQPIVPDSTQIYMNWLMNEHMRNVERAMLGFKFDPRPFGEEAGRSFAEGKARLALGKVNDD